jgi:hypothetical protein
MTPREHRAQGHDQGSGSDGLLLNHQGIDHRDGRGNLRLLRAPRRRDEHGGSRGVLFEEQTPGERGLCPQGDDQGNALLGERRTDSPPRRVREAGMTSGPRGALQTPHIWLPRQRLHRLGFRWQTWAAPDQPPASFPDAVYAGPGQTVHVRASRSPTLRCRAHHALPLGPLVACCRRLLLVSPNATQVCPRFVAC